MRAHRGFTLFEVMVVVAIIGIVATLVVLQGRSARQNARMAGGAYNLALRLGGIRARALADGREYVLVVTDTADPAGCKSRDAACGRILVLRSPAPTFPTAFQAGFDPDAPVALAEYVDDGTDKFVPRNAQFDVGSTWRPPAPFAGVTAFDPNITFTCAGGRACFAIRFRPDGDVRPVIRPNTTIPAGFAFVLRPIEAQSTAADHRAFFISFPAGLVKTAAF